MAEKNKAQTIKELMTKLEHIRNIGIVAHIDHGKCVGPEERIALYNGENLKAKEIFEKYKSKGILESNSNKEVRINVGNLNLFVNSFDIKDGKIKKGRVTHLWKLRKTTPLVEIELENGTKIKTTPEHKYTLLDEEGNFVYKRADEIKENEAIVCSRLLKYKALSLKETKEEIIRRLAKDEGFIVNISDELKKKLHEKILKYGKEKVWEKINSKLKCLSFYHCAWRGQYRLSDLEKVAELFNISLSRIYDEIIAINYRRNIRQRGAKSSVEIKLPKTSAQFKKFFWFVGVLFGDGDVNGNITSKDEEIHKKVKEIAENLLGVEFKLEYYGKSCPRLYIGGGITLLKLLNQVFQYPLKEKSKNIIINEFLEKVKLDYIGSFLKGYFDTDGCVETSRSAISISSASNEMLEKLQLLLYKFDIASKLERKKSCLYISGRASLEKFKRIGFSIKYKKRKFLKLLEKSSSSKLEYVPINLKKIIKGRVPSHYRNYELGYVGLTKNSLKNILNYVDSKQLEKLVEMDTTFSKVKRISFSDKEEYVYDFTVEKFHNFICNDVVVHNTTLTDNLLAGAGMISEDLAGKQLAMDFDVQEQERGITIYAANVSMVHDFKGQSYLVNLIDTPGHVDFGGDVTRAMRAVDGAVVVIDAVEGVMPQTETVLRQALRERVKPILFVNKTDRLIKELKLTPEQMMERFKAIIKEVNHLIQKYAESDYKDKWFVSVEEGSIAFGSALKNWAVSIPFMKTTGVTFKDVIEMTEKGEEKELAKKAPLHQVLLNMVVTHLPNPLQAQKYRISKIWPGEIDSEIGKSMANCDRNGPLAAIVTKIYPDPHAGYVATVRIFSGSIKKGQDIYLSGVEKTEKVQQVSLYKGQKRINMDEVTAGNIVGVVGLKEAFSGCTLSNPEHKIPPFEEIKHIFEPVVTKAIEPKNPKDLAKLIDFLKKTAREDPTLRVNINEDTGEYLVSGLGELHIEAKVERKLKDEGIDVTVSPPIVIYHESVKSATPVPIEGKSPNKHNRFYIVVEPLDPPVYDAMVRGEIGDQEIKRKNVELQNKLVELGFDREEAKRIKLIYNKCMLLDMTHGVHAILEVIEMVKQAFIEAMDNGPLAREPCSAVKVKLVDAKLHEDAIHRGPAQVIPAVRGAIREAMLKANAYIREPKQIIRIDVPIEQVGGATKEINNRRGQIMDMREERGMTIITAKIPVAEMFGFNSALKSATGGLGFYSLIDIVYEPLPKDLEQKVIAQIKQRKGIKDVEE